MSEITYIPKFLTSDEADALFAACAGLDYGERPMTRGGPARHIGVSFADVTTPRARRKGKRRPLISAPDAIQRLGEAVSLLWEECQQNRRHLLP